MKRIWFESLSARLDLVDETILDGKDKEGELIERSGCHQDWLTILTTLVVAFLAGLFALSRMGGCSDFFGIAPLIFGLF